MTRCTNVIDLAKPTSGAWEGRGFGRRFVYTYVCSECGAKRRLRASTSIGSRHVPSVGGFTCGVLLDTSTPTGKEVNDADSR